MAAFFFLPLFIFHFFFVSKMAAGHGLLPVVPRLLFPFCFHCLDAREFSLNSFKVSASRPFIFSISLIFLFILFFNKKV